MDCGRGVSEDLWSCVSKAGGFNHYTFAHTLWATMLVGVIQILLGAGSLSFQKKSFGDSTRNIAGCAFGPLHGFNGTDLLPFGTRESLGRGCS